MTNELSDIIINAEKEILYTEPNNIFHYTSPAGLKGILDRKNIKFHFTRYDCFKDEKEGKHVVDCYKRSCDELLNDKKISKEFFCKIKNLRPSENKSFFNNKKTELSLNEHQVFICCFSLDEDSTYMWNKYQNYRHNLCFLSTKLHAELKRNNGNGYLIYFKKVIYDDERIRIIKSFLKKVYACTQKKDSLLDIKPAIISLLSEWQFAFKSEEDALEKEIRAVVYIPVKPEQESNAPSVKYKEKEGKSIAYIEMSIIKSQLQKIIIGPLDEQELSQSTVTDLIKQRGYKVSDKNIKNSKMPIRF